MVSAGSLKEDLSPDMMIQSRAKELPISCPICAGHDIHKLYTINTYGIYRCRKCRAGFTFPRPEAREVQDLYGDEYLKKYEVSPSHGQAYTDWRFEKVINLIKRAIRSDDLQSSQSIFDVGCATGYFLYRFKSDGWIVNGIDVSTQLSEHAKKVFDLDIFVGDFLTLESMPLSFDLVSMVHVIEHFTDPREALNKVHQINKPGGLVFIETPNWEGIGSLVSKEKWSHLIPPEHLSFFGPNSIRFLAETTGFDVVALQTVVPPYLDAENRFRSIFKPLIRSIYSFSSILNRGPTLQVLLRSRS